jgi:hypothetical protein
MNGFFIHTKTGFIQDAKDFPANASNAPDVREGGAHASAGMRSKTLNRIDSSAPIRLPASSELLPETNELGQTNGIR